MKKDEDTPKPAVTTAPSTPVTTGARPATSATADPFPAHPGFVTFVDVGAGQSKVVPAEQVPDEQRFLYSYGKKGEKIGRVPVIERITTMWNKAGVKVPQAQGCKGVVVLIGPDRKQLQSFHVDKGCHGH